MPVGDAAEWPVDICPRRTTVSVVDVVQAGGPRPPAGLRPAQLGIVLVGRVVLGHVTATLVDLAQRGVLSLDETHNDLDETHAGADEDWLLIDRRGGPDCAGEALLDFERTLLDGLFYGNSLVRMSGLGETFVLPLNQVRKQLRRDAVRSGRLRRWGRGKRTPRGTELLRQIHDFRRELRALAEAGDTGAMAGLAPYAMIFGLSRAASHNSAAEITLAEGNRLAESLNQAFRKIRPSAFRILMTDQHIDFAHAWSAPPGHQPGHGHGQQQSYGESYGHTSWDDHTGWGDHMGGGGHGGH